MNICKNCRFWEPDDGGWGECRRHPPVVVVLATNAGQGPQQHTDARWPETRNTAWCGEFLGHPDAS